MTLGKWGRDVADLVLSKTHDGVAVLTLNNPSSNALTLDMRKAVHEALGAALADPQVTAIVLRGAGGVFCTGVDLGEYDMPLTRPWVGDLCAQIEGAAKPVICALHGAAIGAGFELALAAHGCVAQRQTRFAMSDVKLGMLPGAGGTQRLPRMMGAGRALELLLSGQQVPANDPRLKRVITRLTDADPTADALSLARDMAARGTWPRTSEATTGFADPAGYQAAVHQIRKQVNDSQSVEADIIACVEAAQILPFEQGLAFEEALFQERIASPGARGPRHALMAERKAAELPEQARPILINKIVLRGADALAIEVAAACLAGRAEVTVLTADQAHAKTVTQAVLTHLNTLSPGRSGTDAQSRQDRLLVSADPGVLAEADLILDTGEQGSTNRVALKQRAIWAALRPSVTATATGLTPEPGRAFQVHFHRPAHQVTVVELATTSDADAQAVASFMQACSGMGRSVIRCKPPAGYLGSRMLAALHAAACELVAHGASPYEVDVAARKLGFAAGPFESMDHEGLRQSVNRLNRHAQTRGQGEVETGLLQALADKGRHGRSAARGVYLYSGNGAQRDPLIEDLATELALGDDVAGFTSSRLARALHAALINETATLLAEGAVQRASDLDLLAVRALGFARAKGGPLLQADLAGIFSLLKEMKALSRLSPLWIPQARIAQMVKNGDGFFGRSTGGS